jgi:hypothetical protein
MAFPIAATGIHRTGQAIVALRPVAGPAGTSAAVVTAFPTVTVRSAALALMAGLSILALAVIGTGITIFTFHGVTFPVPATEEPAAGLDWCKTLGHRFQDIKISAQTPRVNPDRLGTGRGHNALNSAVDRCCGLIKAFSRTTTNGRQDRYDKKTSY